MKLTATAVLTVDGVYQGAGGADENTLGALAYSGAVREEEMTPCDRERRVGIPSS